MDTSPQGSAKTVSEAASAFLGLMEPQTEAQAQPEQELQPQQDHEAEEAPVIEASEESEEQEVVEEPTPTYRVKVGKEEVEVSLDELLNGYSRNADYTRKTQELAEKRKAIEAEQSKIQEASALRDQYAQRLQIIEQMLTQPQEDLSALKESDPIGYAVKVAEQAEREKQLAAVRQERTKLAMQQQAEQQNRLRAHLAAESERLQAAIPDMADPAKGEAVRRDIKDYAKSIGFSEQELAKVYDHRAVLTLYKAMQYEKLQKAKPGVAKKVVEAPKTMRPGSTQAPAGDETTKRIRKQLKQSGKTRDAAALFERFL